MAWSFGRAAAKLLNTYWSGGLSVEVKTYSTVYEDPEYDINESYVSEMAHFLKCVQGEERVAVTLDEAAKSLEIVLDAKRGFLTSPGYPEECLIMIETSLEAANACHCRGAAAATQPTIPRVIPTH